LLPITLSLKKSDQKTSIKDIVLKITCGKFLTHTTTLNEGDQTFLPNNDTCTIEIVSFKKNTPENTNAEDNKKTYTVGNGNQNFKLKLSHNTSKITPVLYSLGNKDTDKDIRVSGDFKLKNNKLTLNFIFFERKITTINTPSILITIKKIDEYYTRITLKALKDITLNKIGFFDKDEHEKTHSQISNLDIISKFQAFACRFNNQKNKDSRLPNKLIPGHTWYSACDIGLKHNRNENDTVVKMTVVTLDNREEIHKFFLH
jgi:hypothetical protein